jgi:beta-galactosidase
MKKLTIFFFIFLNINANAQRLVQDFNKNWKFFLGEDSMAMQTNYQDAKWRTLNLPHDWSIELPFDEKAPATSQGGALPGGIGWYRKVFNIAAADSNKNISIELDGVYRNSEVWINGHSLGKRPNGYISFSYDLTPYIQFGKTNTIAVRVDNSRQPNSRWYTGSGIYRNVRLVVTGKIAIDYQGTFVSTSAVSVDHATIHIATTIKGLIKHSLQLQSLIYNPQGILVAQKSTDISISKNSITDNKSIEQTITIPHPSLWDIQHPTLYKVVHTIVENGKVIDSYPTKFGIRYFNFDTAKGFSLNGVSMKIKGVCMHHDLGALGAAINISAMERQLRILKEMGCNAIRTAHNPPAPEFLDACDRMGFLVMDESFDMWKRKKNKYDYSLDFPLWHEKDLKDQIIRDRNHPSVFIWSVGNEIPEQYDSSGIKYAKELVSIVKSLDTTRPITSAFGEWNPEKNFLYKSGAFDLVGLNYHQETYADFRKYYPGQKFIAAETMSALASRGHYDFPSDSMRYWPQKSPMKFVEGGNPDFTVSAYDHVAAYWGSSHETTWKIIKKYDFLSGLFVWSGFDFLGEPLPYPFPARSAYYGIVDLAGFPKDSYYMYQSEWTNKPVLHIFPHWNWKPGQVIDIWAYYSQADEVELFLNGKSLGTKQKIGDDLHVMWRVPFEAGTLKAVSRKNHKVLLTKEIKTAGAPYQIKLFVEKGAPALDGKGLAFVQAQILDKNGNIVPNADNLVQFTTDQKGSIVATDNGNPTDLTLFSTPNRKALNGLCLVILRPKNKGKQIQLTAKSNGLVSSTIFVAIP